MNTGMAFRYELEPVRQKRKWMLDAARTRLDALQSQLAACEQAAHRLKQRCENEAESFSVAWQRCSDPRARSAAIAHLASLQRELAELATRSATLRDEVHTARVVCHERNIQAEAIEEHRRVAAIEARARDARRIAFEADSDWTLGAARRHGGVD